MQISLRNAIASVTKPKTSVGVLSFTFFFFLNHRRRIPHSPVQAIPQSWFVGFHTGEKARIVFSDCLREERHFIDSQKYGSNDHACFVCKLHAFFFSFFFVLLMF
jgi:hypothetical protein